VLGSLVAEEDPRGGRSYIGSVADVTERMRLEREAAYGRRLEAMIRSVGRIAHEFNNALMSMLGYSDLARMRAQRAGLDDVARWLGQSREATERAQALVAQMVQYARGGRASAAATDLGELVEIWAADARARGALQGCTLTVAAAPGLPPVVLDPDELRVILDNLLANAVDAAGDGGHVELGVRLARGVDAECVISHRRVQGDRVVVEMRDDGPGMAPQVLDRIFDPFFTTKEVDAGVGLGLSVVEGLLRSMGAGALVESAPGRGTAMRLLFLPADA
jgi:signal transduction histidine kinase